MRLFKIGIKSYAMALLLAATARSEDEVCTNPAGCSKPTLIYWPLWGRGEPIRLALAAAGVAWDEEEVDMPKMKAAAGTAAFPYGQAPAYVDGSLRMSQMDAVLRHIGRKHGLYGDGLDEAAKIDMVMLGVEDLRKAYLTMAYNDDAESLLDAFVNKHFDPSTKHAKNGGAHFSYLAGILERNGAETGYIVGSSLSIADIQVYNICEMVLREQFPRSGLFREHQPLLTAYAERIAAEPKLAAYIASRPPNWRVNGNTFG